MKPVTNADVRRTFLFSKSVPNDRSSTMMTNWTHAYKRQQAAFIAWPTVYNPIGICISCSNWLYWETIEDATTIMKISGAYSVLLTGCAIFLSGPIDNASGWSLQTSTGNSRRELLQQGAATLLGGASLAFPLPASAVANPTPADLERLRKGHARVKYLLEHWDEETQVCGKMIMSDLERKQVVRTDGESRDVFYSRSYPWDYVSNDGFYRSTVDHILTENMSFVFF